MTKNVFFWGAKYKAGIIYNLIINDKTTTDVKDLKIKYLFDPNLDKPKFSSEGIFSNNKKDLDYFIKDSEYFITCIGNELGMARYYISKELEKRNLKPLSIISKNAYLDNNDCVGLGVQIFPNSVVHTNSIVGDYSILNTGSILEHDCKIGNGVHLMPGSVIGGNTLIGDFVTIGMNATVMPQLKIESGAFIGAGALVTKNVKKNEVVVGNPAKFLKYVSHEFDLKIFK